MISRVIVSVLLATSLAGGCDRMPVHRQMLADVLVQVEREMQRLGVMGDARWSALADSLKKDRGDDVADRQPGHETLSDTKWEGLTGAKWMFDRQLPP